MNDQDKIKLQSSTDIERKLSGNENDNNDEEFKKNNNDFQKNKKLQNHLALDNLQTNHLFNKRLFIFKQDELKTSDVKTKEKKKNTVSSNKKKNLTRKRNQNLIIRQNSMS